VVAYLVVTVYYTGKNGVEPTTGKNNSFSWKLALAMNCSDLNVSLFLSDPERGGCDRIGDQGQKNILVST
jgi:hypothetical protein